MTENNLEQLWVEEQSKRIEDLAELNGDSEEYIEEEADEGRKESQLSQEERVDKPPATRALSSC